jgi:hypothetical protein
MKSFLYLQGVTVESGDQRSEGHSHEQNTGSQATLKHGFQTSDWTKFVSV